VEYLFLGLGDIFSRAIYIGTGEKVLFYVVISRFEFDTLSLWNHECMKCYRDKLFYYALKSETMRTHNELLLVYIDLKRTNFTKGTLLVT